MSSQPRAGRLGTEHEVPRRTIQRAALGPRRVPLRGGPRRGRPASSTWRHCSAASSAATASPALAGGWVCWGRSRLITHPADPGAAWPRPAAAPPAALLWLILALLLVAAVVSVLQRAVLVGAPPRGPRAARPAAQAPRLPLPPARPPRRMARPRRGGGRPGSTPASRPSELRQRPIARARHPPRPLRPDWTCSPPTSTPSACSAACARARPAAHGPHRPAPPGPPRRSPPPSPPTSSYVFAAPAGAPGRPSSSTPTALSGLPTAAFDPTLGCEDPDAARLSAQAMLAQQRARGRDRGLDWALLAEKMLKYLLHAAALEHLDRSRAADPQRPVGMARVVQWVGRRDAERAPRTCCARAPRRPTGRSCCARTWRRSAPETFYSHQDQPPRGPRSAGRTPGILARMAPGRSPLGDVDPAALVRNRDRLLVIARPGGHAIPLVTALVVRGGGGRPSGGPPGPRPGRPAGPAAPASPRRGGQGLPAAPAARAGHRLRLPGHRGRVLPSSPWRTAQPPGDTTRFRGHVVGHQLPRGDGPGLERRDPARSLRPLPDGAGRGAPRGPQRPRASASTRCCATSGPSPPTRSRPSPSSHRRRLLRAAADAPRHPPRGQRPVRGPGRGPRLTGRLAALGERAPEPGRDAR